MWHLISQCFNMEVRSRTSWWNRTTAGAAHFLSVILCKFWERIFHSSLLLSKESYKTILELGRSSNTSPVHGMAVRPCWRPDSETSWLLSWCNMSRRSSRPADIQQGKILHVVSIILCLWASSSVVWTGSMQHFECGLATWRDTSCCNVIRYLAAVL